MSFCFSQLFLPIKSFVGTVVNENQLTIMHQKNYNSAMRTPSHPGKDVQQIFANQFWFPFYWCIIFCFNSLQPHDTLLVCFEVSRTTVSTWIIFHLYSPLSIVFFRASHIDAFSTVVCLRPCFRIRVILVRSVDRVFCIPSAL